MDCVDAMHSDIQSFVNDLFDNSHYIARIELDMPKATYQSIIEVLSKYEELFQERRLKCAFVKESIGYRIIIDRTERLTVTTD